MTGKNLFKRQVPYKRLTTFPYEFVTDKFFKKVQISFVWKKRLIK